MPLFAVFLLLRGNLQDLALPDFLGIDEVNSVLTEVLQALPFIPFKQHICIVSVYYTYNQKGGKERVKKIPASHPIEGSCGRLMRRKQAFIRSFLSAAATHSDLRLRTLGIDERAGDHVRIGHDSNHVGRCSPTRMTRIASWISCPMVSGATACCRCCTSSTKSKAFHPGILDPR
jgi:hypothetical protein